MPKQVQYTKHDIVNASIEIIRSQGSEALTARAIGKRLECSVGPVFRTFDNMDDLMVSVREKAEDIISKYVAESVGYRPAFKELGMRLIRFAKEEPNLFHFLFLDKGARCYSVDNIAKECLRQTASDFELTEEQAEYVYEQSWPYTCGLALLCSRNPEQYTEKSISKLFTTQFIALLMLIKSNRDVIDIIPQPIVEESGLADKPIMDFFTSSKD